MQNIDPVYFLTPITVIAFSFGLAAYWRVRRRFTAFTLLFSLAAYFGAIIVKVIFQSITYTSFDRAVGGNHAALGAYFGLQTAFLEVGGAYLVASYAYSRGMIKANDAEGYGIGLALWENGVFLGIPLLLDYIVYYGTLSAAGAVAAPARQQLFSTLQASAPSLFYSPSAALPLIGYSVLERVSSLIFHFSWGYLSVLAVALRKRTFLLAALPMGLVDFTVPFSGVLGVATYEGLVFLLSLLALGATLMLTRGESRTKSIQSGSAPPQSGTANLRSLFYTNFRRALSFGKVYVIIAMVLPLLFIFETSVAGSAAKAAGAAGSSAAGASILGEIYPLFLPLFVVLGSVGALMIFASDKDKGVYEYMLAYGVDVSTIFWAIIVASLGIVTLVLAISLVISVVAIAATGGTLTVVFGELILFYTIPLSYAATMFMSMAGMIWSQLTSRRPGVNSPVGVAPMLGIFPVLAVFLIVVISGASDVLYIVGGASIAMVCAVVGMASIANKRMQRERFLSNA
jgi:hypothetical protein